MLERGLRSEDIINQAESSQATFYRKFTKKSDFIAAVIRGLNDSTWSTPTEVSHVVRAHLTRSDEELRPAVVAMVTEYFGSFTNESTIAQNLLAQLFARSNGPGTHSVQSGYGRRDELALAAYEASFDRNGESLRRPFTAKSFAITVNALIEGFRIRSLSDPKSVTVDVVADALIALLGAMVDTSGNHGHLDDTVSALDSAGIPRSQPRDARAAIITSARTELGKRGYFLTRIDDIADQASVPRAAVKKLFPSKAHILVAALQARVDQLRESIADDVLIGMDAVTIIENFMLRCAQLAADEIEFMDALLVAVAHDTYGEPEGLLSIKEKLNLPAIIAPVIQQGQDSGVFTDLSSPVDIAAGMTNTLLLRCFTRRSTSPEDNAAFIGGLLLNGLVGR